MSHDFRIPPVVPGTKPELADLEAAIRSERGGEIAVLYQILLNSPPIASGWEQMLTAVRNRTGIPAELRELIILRVAVLNRASFEFAAHAPHAREAGVSEEKIRVVENWQDSLALFSDDERLVLDVTDRMTRDIEVPDILMESLRTRFDARGAVEVAATVAAYNMVSRFLVAFNIIHCETSR
ncbi:carboxymuconolactone decarboxylase family protein [Streptomyces sp. NPDC094034]|uniref:carboxymuconolactone decarboxylase family protein n=1 Tax=Streptomyces sp. NPDC094034 TaxID=3155309 RepID=UPI003323381C